MNPNALKNLLVSLSTTGTRFILVGGLAVELCGYARATYDVDILIDHEEANIACFLDTVSKIGEGYAKELSTRDFDLTEGCITIHENELQIDVFTIMGGHTYAKLLPFTSLHQIDASTSILHLNIEGLLLLKSQSARPKDQNDVLHLQQLLPNS
jgi:predicted nucleotidyltransferase